MKLKSLKIHTGTQTVSLRECNLFPYSLDSVEFLTEHNDYSFSLQKTGLHGRIDSPSPIFKKESGKIPTYYFSQFRDGMTHITIESSCDGLFHFYFIDPPSYAPNPIEQARQDMEDKAIAKHYIKFIKHWNDYILIDDDFYKKYTYYPKHKELHRMCDDRDNSHLYETKNNKHLVVRAQYVLTGFEIDSNDDCNCIIKVGYNPIFKLDIKKGKHFYPFNLILCCLVYHIVELYFDSDCIKSIRQEGLGMPRYIRDLILGLTMISKEQDKDVVYYQGMMSLITPDNCFPSYSFLKEHAKPLTFSQFQAHNPRWNSKF